MNSNDAIKKIADLIKKHLKGKEDEIQYLARKIYADVVATSIEDERGLWIAMSVSGRDGFDS